MAPFSHCPEGRETCAGPEQVGEGVPCSTSFRRTEGGAGPEHKIKIRMILEQQEDQTPLEAMVLGNGGVVTMFQTEQFRCFVPVIENPWSTSVNASPLQTRQLWIRPYTAENDDVWK